jgi:hypothetical protein
MSSMYTAGQLLADSRAWKSCLPIACGAPDPDIGVAAFIVPEGRTQCLFDQVNQVVVLGRGADEYECLP